jgi:LCP family protein required for cell wall assembly
LADGRKGKHGRGVPERSPSGLPPHLDPRGGGRRGSVPPRVPPRLPSGTGERPGGAPPAREVVPSRPRRRARRVLSWVAAITSIALLLTAAGGYLLVNRYDDNISRVDAFGEVEGAGSRPAPTSRGAKNILIVGSDSRGDLAAGEGTQGKGDAFVTGQRSDTVILAHLYGDSDMAQLVSFPRDAWVTIPAHVSPESGELVPARESKLNAAFFEGGPPLLIDTIEELTGLRIDNYMQIDFDGFQDMVDELGGVEVCLSAPAKEKDSGINLPAGVSTIKGDQALAFVRQRKGLPRGDLDRIARQQQFIGAIVRKTLSAGTLLNLFKLNDVITVATRSLKVDEGMSFGDLRDLALRFQGFEAGGVIFATVPVTDIAARRGGESVVLIDEAQAAELFAGLRRDDPPGTAPAAEPPTDGAGVLTVPPSDISVEVFNGAGVAGLGRRVADDLAELDFDVAGPPGNRGTGAKATVVRHGPDDTDSARTLAAAIPGATTELSTTLDGTLEVVVGSGYSGTTPVTVAGAPAPPPVAESPAPEVKTAADDPCAA